MASEDIRRYSRDDIKAMKTRGEVQPTPSDAPSIELDEAFWDKARLVSTRVPRKASVHLRVDPGTLEFFRAEGPGHLSRMAKVLKAYADTRGKNRNAHGG